MVTDSFKNKKKHGDRNNVQIFQPKLITFSETISKVKMEGFGSYDH